MAYEYIIMYMIRLQPLCEIMTSLQDKCQIIQYTENPKNHYSIGAHPLGCSISGSSPLPPDPP